MLDVRASFYHSLFAPKMINLIDHSARLLQYPSMVDHSSLPQNSIKLMEVTMLLTGRRMKAHLSIFRY